MEPGVMANSQRSAWHFFNLFEKLMDRDSKNKILDSVPPIPDQVRSWLGRLCLLYGVPFSYLVPDEKMLETESLRFFYLDPQWMECLVDGALSVGRSSDVRLLLGKAMAANFLAEEVMAEAKKVRPGLQGKEVVPSPSQGTWQITGFLLRSAVVAGWRGLEIKAYGDKSDKPLPILRLERISKDVMLCLFEGIMKRLVITQPPEGLHFGVQPNPKSPLSYVKKIRALTGEKEITSDDGPFAVPLRNDAQRVIKVKALAAEIQRRIGREPTSAEFAVEMVEKPVRYTIEIKEM